VIWSGCHVISAIAHASTGADVATAMALEATTPRPIDALTADPSRWDSRQLVRFP
jgi:hypothetical protein